MKAAASVSICLALAGLGVFVFRQPILSGVGDFLTVSDPLQPVDVIHVVAGLDHRAEYAIQLYQQGYARYIFFTGGWCETHGYHGERGRQMALAAGIPADRVGLDDSSVVSTYQEVERLKSWMDGARTPIRSVMVVSDPHHMRRARWTYRKVLGEGASLVMAPVPFDQTPYERRWWEDVESVVYVREEYLKLAYSLARYQYSWGPVREWLASLDTQ